MSFFDLLFPEWATATHLRTLTEQNQANQTQTRIAQSRAERIASASKKDLERRVESLEIELGQAALVMEALMEKFEEKQICSKQEMMGLIQEIDARDGMIDGRITPQKPEPFESKREWKEAKKPKFNFPDS